MLALDRHGVAVVVAENKSDQEFVACCWGRTAVYILFQAGIAVWFLFMAMTLYYIYLLFRKKQDRVEPVGKVEAIESGELGDYVVDGDDSYGLYLRLCGWNVFVDVRQDEQLEAKKMRAYGLFENSSLLENSAKEFRLANPGYGKCTISIIGLHSADINQCEVFWEPEGYTLIRGYVFVAD